MDSDGREKNRKGGGGEVGKRHNEKPIRCPADLRRKTSQPRKRAMPPLRESRCGPSRIAPRRRDWSAMPTTGRREAAIAGFMDAILKYLYEEVLQVRAFAKSDDLHTKTE